MAEHKGEGTEFRFLKSILTNPEYYYEYRDSLFPTVFESPRSRDIWGAITFIDKHKPYPLDINGVEALLEKNSKKLISDILEVWDVFKAVKLPQKPEFYCEIMAKRARLMKIASISDKINVYAESEEISECLELLEQQREAILKIDAPDQDLMDSETIIGLWLEHQAKIDPDNNGIIGARSGFLELDKITRGFKPGELIIIGARPSVGKSALMSSMITNMMKEEPIAAFSLEMSSIEMYTRIIAVDSKLPLSVINNKSYINDPDQNTAFSKSVERIKTYRILMNDRKHTVRQIEVALRKAKAANPDLRVCFIDYLQIIQPSERYKAGHSSNHQIISDISAKLKLIAKELGVAVIALAQLNRAGAAVTAGEDPRPVMANLKESGNIEQDADIIILLHRRKAKEDKGEVAKVDVDIVDLHVEKNRNGRLGTVTCQHFKKWTLFRKYST